MNGYKEIAPEDVQENIFTMIGERWMLITAGTQQICNTMTASWGGMGVLWSKPVATIYIRPQRYPNEFVDANDRLTISFLPENYRKALSYCGSHSGCDGDKIADAGLSSALTPDGTPYIGEADTVFLCRKMYVDRLDESKFIEPDIAGKWYPERDFHIVYICEIEKVYVKE